MPTSSPLFSKILNLKKIKVSKMTQILCISSNKEEVGTVGAPILLLIDTSMCHFWVSMQLSTIEKSCLPAKLWPILVSMY